MFALRWIKNILKKICIAIGDFIIITLIFNIYFYITKLLFYLIEPASYIVTQIIKKYFKEILQVYYFSIKLIYTFLWEITQNNIFLDKKNWYETQLEKINADWLNYYNKHFAQRFDDNDPGFLVVMFIFIFLLWCGINITINICK